jgi:hypothetical protein
MVHHSNLGHQGKLLHTVDGNVESVGVDAVLDRITFEMVKELPEEVLSRRWECVYPAVSESQAFRFIETVGGRVCDDERRRSEYLVTAVQGLVGNEATAFARELVFLERRVCMLIHPGQSSGL